MFQPLKTRADWVHHLLKCSAHAAALYTVNMHTGSQRHEPQANGWIVGNSHLPLLTVYLAFDNNKNPQCYSHFNAKRKVVHGPG